MPPSAEKPNYYELLGVSREASLQEIKSAYRRLARQHHPDVKANSGVTDEHFKRINEAYQTLSNPTKRQFYDLQLGPKGPPPGAGQHQRTGKATTPPPKSEPSQQTKAQSSPPPAAKPVSSTQETIEQLQQWFEQWRASKAEAKQEPGGQPGDDLTLELMLTTEEAKAGVVKTLGLEKHRPCKVCVGTGKVNGRVCGACDGQGHHSSTSRLEVKLPAGVKTGSKVRVAGEGHPGMESQASGDLYIKIIVQEPEPAAHDSKNKAHNESKTEATAEKAKAPEAPAGQLVTEGQTVRLLWEVDIPTAVLGGKLMLPTLHGTVAFQLPAGTQHGQTFRLKGQGVKTGNTPGDQLVKIHVTIPKSLTIPERALYEALKRQSG